jgi:hypothetical protein
MLRIFFCLVALSSFPLTTTAEEPQAAQAKAVLEELKTKWKAAVVVDSNDPDSPVVGVSFSNCHAEEVTDLVLWRLRFFPRLRDVMINSEAVTDKGMKYLRELPELQKLTLIRVPLTAKGLDTLKGMPKLKQLTLFRMEVSRVALEDLREALPRTTIEWRKP